MGRIFCVIIATLLFEAARGLIGHAWTRYRASRSMPRSSLALFAKKKAPKLISDDLLASLSVESTNDHKEGTDPVKDKDKRQNKRVVSEQLLSSIIENEDSTLDSGSKKKKKKKENTSNGSDTQDRVLDGAGISDGEELHSRRKEQDVAIGGDHDGATDPVDNENDTEIISEGLTIEQKIRREKPSARVRFTESTQPGYVMMGLEKVGLVYGNNVILKEASFGVTSGERVGLVGPNGSGKSTTLRILAGEVEPTNGDVVKSSPNLRVAFLRQEFVEGLMMDNTLKQELFSAFVEQQRILSDIAQCEKELADTTDDADKMQAVLQKMDQLQEMAMSKGAYSLEPKLLKVMNSMGFTEDDGNALVSSFSGGWKMRIGLAKILLLDPNVIFLDEPTNHMDLDSVMWLEDFLAKQNLPMVVVSHDREFLDKVCTKIVDVEDGKMVSYQGNYSNFLAQRRERLMQWREKHEKQNKQAREEEKWIKRHSSDPSMAQQVKAKEMALQKLLNSEEWVGPPPRDKKFRFRFPPPPRCGERVLEVSGLQHGYGQGKYKVLFKDVDFTVDRGQRVGFVGPNGSGKSTMMRILYGLEEPQQGFAEFASNSVVASYYAQNQADALDLDLTVLETVQQAADSDVSLTEIRTLLGQFMFKGDDAAKTIRMLSGGEKARVAMCRLMLKPANLLLLDEPTNHLDITTKEVLEDALLHYPGAVLIVSHDRYFMSQAANTIFAFHDKIMERFDCDYHDYMFRMSEGAADGAAQGLGSRDDSAASLKDKIQARYVKGDRYQITNAKEVQIQDDTLNKKKKNFGGSGVTSGNLFKGIKNAKRFGGR